MLNATNSFSYIYTIGSCNFEFYSLNALFFKDRGVIYFKVCPKFAVWCNRLLFLTAFLSY